jgi:hypothetical protein
MNGSAPAWLQDVYKAVSDGKTEEGTDLVFLELDKQHQISVKQL